jgi:transcriptional regulator with XRE-family HTH domain
LRIYDFEGKKNISGERIREARLKLRLSQSDLAARVQVEGVTKEVNALSKRKKKRGNKAEPDSYLNLVTAILNLVIAILLLTEKLTE